MPHKTLNLLGLSCARILQYMFSTKATSSSSDEYADTVFKESPDKDSGRIQDWRYFRTWHNAAFHL